MATTKADFTHLGEVQATAFYEVEEDTGCLITSEGDITMNILYEL